MRVGSFAVFALVIVAAFFSGGCSKPAESPPAASRTAPDTTRHTRGGGLPEPRIPEAPRTSPGSTTVPEAPVPHIPEGSGAAPVSSVVDPAVRGLPTAVARTRSHLLDAIRSGNDDGLLDEIGERRDVPFSYTFGDPVEGGAVAFWRRLKRNGHSDPFAILGRLLGGAPARRDSLYVWPDWFDRPLVAFNEAQKESLERLTSPGMYEKMRSNGFYIGPRTAIRADGLWMFYVSGD